MTSSPSLSFGSNQVDFGGMMPPASEIAIRSSTVTGNIENATAALPESTACSSAAVPRAPPTKSMRLSVRMSPMPQHRLEHGALQPGDVQARGARVVGRPRRRRWSSVYHLPAEIHRHVTLACRRRRPSA